MSGRLHKTGLALPVALVAVAVLAAPASAATTRAEYVAQVDPICQSGEAQVAVAAVPLNKAAKRLLKHPENLKATKRFFRLFAKFSQEQVAIERGVNAQIAAITPATEDVSLVQVWLRVRNEALDLQGHGPAKLPKGLKGFGKLFDSLLQLLIKQGEAADLVRDFGFQYCNVPSGEFQVIATLPVK